MSRVYKGTDLSELKIIELGEAAGDLLEVAVYGLCLDAELFVLLITDVLALDLLPAFNLVEGADNAAEFALLEVNLPERVAAFAQ